MLRDQPLLNLFLLDVLLCAVWHYGTFYICITLPKAFFNPDKKMYQPHAWEHNGRFYSDVLKMNTWKDLLPQHIGKDGFSKDHLDDISLEYLDEFIMETCRAEWNHTMNCLFAVVLLLLNGLAMALILTFLLLLGNLPFALIQRYNRFRLQRLRESLQRRMEREARKAARSAQPQATLREE